MENLKISIIIPTYGRAEYLKELILSVRQSTPANEYELIVVSSDPVDCDKVKWLLEQSDVRLINADSRKKWQQRKKSLYYYTNLGIYQARNEWIFVVNDDMRFDKDWHNEFVNIIKSSENRNVGMIIVSTHIGDVESGSRVVKLGQIKKNDQLKDIYLSDLSIIRSDIIKKIGYFDEGLNWYGSGADNSLAVELLTDAETIIAEKIKVDHFISDEHREVNAGDAFEDFNYIIRKWDRWCSENNCEYFIKFNIRPYTVKNRFMYWMKRFIKRGFLSHYRDFITGLSKSKHSRKA